MTKEEVIISLGLDSGAATRGMADFGATAKNSLGKVGEEAGKAFTTGWKKMLQGISFVAMMAKVRAVVSDFKAVEADAEALKQKFGELGEAERIALGNAAESAQRADQFINRTVAKLTGLYSDASQVLSTMFFEGKGFSAATDQVLDQQFADAAQRKAAIEKKAADERDAREIAAIERFNNLRDQLAFKRMAPIEKIAFLEKRIGEYQSKAAHEGKTDMEKRYYWAGKILETEETIAGIRNSQSPGPLVDEIPEQSKPMTAGEAWNAKWKGDLASYYRGISQHMPDIGSRMHFNFLAERLQPTRGEGDESGNGMLDELKKLTQSMDKTGALPVNIKLVDDDPME